MPCWRAFPIPIRAPACVKKSPRSASITSVDTNPGRISGSRFNHMARPSRYGPSPILRKPKTAMNPMRSSTLSSRIKVRPAYWCVTCRKTTSATITPGPTATVGSDGPSVSPYGVTGQGQTASPSLWHGPSSDRTLCPGSRPSDLAPDHTKNKRWWRSRSVLSTGVFFAKAKRPMSFFSMQRKSLTGQPSTNRILIPRGSML